MKLIPLYLFALFTLPLCAQKVDLDGETVAINYTRLPLKPLPADYRTYSAVLSANPGDLQKFGLEEQFFTNNLKVAGYQKVKEGGNFNLEANLSDYKQLGGERKTRTNQQVDKNGKVVSTTTTYYYEGQYAQSLTLRIKAQDGRKLEERTWLGATRTYTSQDYKSPADQSEYLRLTYSREVTKNNREALMAAMKEMYEYLQVQYGYAGVAQEFKMQVLDSEKHPDYLAFQQAFQGAKAALATAKAEEPLDAVRTQLEPSISWFLQQKDKYDSGEKSQRKLKYACLYDLALLYFWTEDLDKAMEFANAVIANDYDPKDGKHLIEDITELKVAYAKTGKNTRHLHFDVKEEIAEPAADQAVATTPVVYENDSQARKEAHEEETEERRAERKRKSLGLTANTAQYEGWVVGPDGKEIKVLFLIENPRVAGIAFALEGNVRYAIEKPTIYQVYRMDKSKLVSFGFEGRTFKVMQFKTATAVNLGNSKCVLEVIYESPKINAYLAYTGDHDGLDKTPEYVIERVDKQDMISLSGVKFAFSLNKGIKKVFDDCPAAVEAAEGDGFKRDPGDITRLAKLLEGCYK